MINHLAIAGVCCQRNPVALIDHQERKGAVLKSGQIAYYRLHRAKYHLTAALLAPQAGTEDICLKAVSPVLGVVLLDQLAHVGQHQYPPPGQTRQFSNHQGFTTAGRQRHHGGVVRGTEMGHHPAHRFLLIGTQGGRWLELHQSKCGKRLSTLAVAASRCSAEPSSPCCKRASRARRSRSSRVSALANSSRAAATARGEREAISLAISRASSSGASLIRVTNPN